MAGNPTTEGGYVPMISKFLYVLRGHRLQLIGMVGLFVLLSAMDVLGVGLIGPFVAAVVQPERLLRFPHLNAWLGALGQRFDLNPLSTLGFILLVVFAGKGGFAYGLHHRILSFAFSVRASLIKCLMQAYLAMPYQFFLDRNSSELLQSVVNNTKVMTDDLLIPVMRSISDGLVLTLIGAFLFVVNPHVMLLFSAAVAIAFLLYARTVRPRTRSAGEQVARANERIIRGVSQTIAGIKDVRVLGLEKAFKSFIESAADANTVAQVRFNSYLVLPRYLMETVVVLFILAMTLATVIRGKAPADLVAMLAMFAAAGLRALPAMSQVSSSLASMHYSSFALDNLYADLRALEGSVYRPESTPESGGRERTLGRQPIGESFQEVRLENVSFAYPGMNTLALAGVNLAIRHGSSVGIIGESGSGKTTFVDVLLGLHTVKSGRILLDGLDLNAIGWNRWTGLVAYIPQTVFIVDDTLKRNVALGIADSDVDAERLGLAIEMAQLKALVARLPQGIDSRLGEHGGRLSGGERQRIALARAFYHNRDVLIFDEATSALDAETERDVIKAIESLRGIKTVIVVAHRLTTVAHCDVVHRFNRGGLIRSGSLEEVLRV